MYLLAMAFFFAMSSFFSMVKIIFVSIDKISPLDEESTLTRTINAYKELREIKTLSRPLYRSASLLPTLPFP